MLALVLDTSGVEVQPLVVNVFRCADERLRLATIPLEMTIGSENANLILLQESAELMQHAHQKLNPLRRTGAALKGALKNLREFGARYRRPKDVSNAILAIEKLIGKDDLNEDHNIFLEMLGLPLTPRATPLHRRHRKKNIDFFPRFSADHIFPGGLMVPSSHPSAVPSDGTTFSSALSSTTEERESNCSSPDNGAAAGAESNATTPEVVVQTAGGEIQDDLLDSFLQELDSDWSF